MKRLYAIPNGGSRHKAEAKNLKKSGVRAGVPDLHLPVAKRGYNGLWIEMKSINGRTSNKQTDWINGLQELGHAVFVCYGADEAIEKLKWYLNEIHKRK